MATTTLPATRQPLAPFAVTAWTVALFWTSTARMTGPRSR